MYDLARATAAGADQTVRCNAEPGRAPLHRTASREPGAAVSPAGCIICSTTLYCTVAVQAVLKCK